MSKHPSISAAIKRLRQWFSDYPIVESDPYRHDGYLYRDIELVINALQLAADCAKHTDDRDACPIFEMKLPCTWTAANKGFLHALSQCRRREPGDE